MTKRLTAALLCTVVALGVGGVAAAQAKSLTYKQAKALAKRLADRQVRARDLVSFHLRPVHRRSAHRVVFAYDDRTPNNVFCTARIVVVSSTKGRTTTIRAKFTRVECNGIPPEVLRFEALTRQAQRDLRANTAGTVDSLDNVKRSTKRCARVQVPRSKADEGKALFDIALVEALERPNDAALGNFAASLVDVDASNATLSSAADAWADWIAVARSLPDVSDPCAMLKDWKQAGFAESQAPIDFVAYRSLDKRASADNKAIDKAAALMLRRGAFPNASLGFTTRGMLLQLAAKAGITGGKEKVKPALAG